MALGCALMLAKEHKGLEDTDVPSGVLEVLHGGVEKVVVVGWRGHVQGAFTIKVGPNAVLLQFERILHF